MRKIGALLAVVVGIAGLGVGCKKSKADPSVVVTSIFPIYDLTKRVGGDKIEVQLLLRPGASAHDFNPSTKQMRKASRAGLAFIIGLELDEWTTKALEAASGKAKIVRLGDRVKATKFDTKRIGDDGHGDQKKDHDDHDDKVDEKKDHDDHVDHDDEKKDHDKKAHDDHDDDEKGHDGHDHDGLDPHIWLSVPKAMAMVDVIADELSKALPKHARSFRDNAKKLKGELSALHAEIKKTTATFTKKSMVTYHGSFGYFAVEYGLHIVAVIEPYPGRQPSAAYLKKVIAAVKGKPIAALYTEPQLDTRPANVLAKETNLPLKVLDPIGGLGERNSYEGLMRYNLRQLVESMK